MTLEATIRADRGACTLDLRLSIAAGETLVLVGPNGAGKSTLLDVLAGLSPLSSGRVEIGGVVVDARDDHGDRDVHLSPPDRGVGVMFQDLALFPHMSALDNVAYGLRCRGVANDAANDRARAWLGRLGIADLAPRTPPSLSGGQAQRVALARAMITEPPLLLLDEPLSSLDVSNRRSARELLRSTLSSLLGAKLVITHDARDLTALADRVAVIEDGRIVTQGTCAERLARPESPHLAAMLREQGLCPDAAP